MSQVIIRKATYTLEILVVAVIVSILAAIAVPKFTNATLCTFRRKTNTHSDVIRTPVPIHYEHLRYCRL
jgi:Tfp pilus assembly protein PilE